MRRVNGKDLDLYMCACAPTKVMVWNDETILTSLLTLTKCYAPTVFLSLLAATILALGMSVREHTNCHYHAVLF